MARSWSCFLQLAALVLLCLSAASCTAVAKEKVGIYQLGNGFIRVGFTNYGATLISLILPDKLGKYGDVVLGYDSVKGYYNDSTYFGAVVGRVANRISGAQFTLNGVRYRLDANEGKNMLHGGIKGFSRVVWRVEKYVPHGRTPHVTFTYISRDGEEGFPGDVKVRVTYKLVRRKELVVDMSAKSMTKPTPINLAQHTYWNLGGHSSGDILSHTLQIFGSRITPVDKHLIPTGNFESVKGTPFDFLQPHTVGSRIKKLPAGYDVNYVLDGGERKSSGGLKHVAVVAHKGSGRRLELWSNQPGVQLYTSNMLKNVTGKGGCVYKPHAGLCLETQDYPDAVNHPNFPSEIVGPGKTYRHYMLFKFSVDR